MNILLVSHDLSITGAPHSLLRQACYFRDLGHTVDVWSFRDGNLKAQYIKAGFNPIIIENSVEAIRKQYKKINKKYDFILCNTTVTYKAVDVLQRHATPLVWFIRETKLVDEGIHNSPSFADVFRNFYNIYTVSDYAANVIKKYNNNVQVINNAVADEFKKFKKNGRKIVFGYIGSIMPVKGNDILLKAFKKLSVKLPNVELRLAGGCYTDWATTLKNRSIKNVKWLGEVSGSDKQSFFENIDVLVVPSLDEPSGLTVIEGAMYGKPIITTDKTGAKYMVKDGVSGFIVKAGNVNSLHIAMSKILMMDLKDMQRKSRNMYLKYGTPERERQEVIKMLEDNKNFLPIIKNKMLKKSYFKIFNKERLSNGRRHIYFCGIKVLSYNHKKG